MTMSQAPKMSFEEHVEEELRDIKAAIGIVRKDQIELAGTVEIIGDSISEIGKAVGVEKQIEALASQVKHAARRRKK